MKLKASMSAAAIVLVLAGCGNLFEPAAAAVHGAKITVEEVEEALEAFEKTMQYERLTEQSEPDAIRRQFEQGHLAQEIRRRVLEPAAEELGVTVSDTEVQDRLDEIAAGYPSQSSFEEALREQGLTVDDLETLVRDRTLEEKLREEVTKSIGAGDDELRQYYDNNIQQFTVMEARHVLVEQRTDAEAIVERLRDVSGTEQEELFARIARKQSLDRQSAESGGNLGVFASGDFVKPFEDAAFELPVGEISDPVKTEFGWHVIQVLDREQEPFETVSEEIDEELSGPAKEEAWTQWVIDAYEEADVAVNSRYGELDLETQLIVDPGPEQIPGAEVPSPSPTPTATIP